MLVEKHIERTVEEEDLNLVYKVVGRKGEKRKIKVPLRYGEVLVGDGKVIREDKRGLGAAARPLGTGGNSEPLGNAKVLGIPVPKKTPTKPAVSESVMGENKDEQVGGQVDNNVSGDGWQPAAEKRGRNSPSPDKVMKKSRGGAVTEFRNRFQRMAEDIFRVEEK